MLPTLILVPVSSSVPKGERKSFQDFERRYSNQARVKTTTKQLFHVEENISKQSGKAVHQSDEGIM